MSIKSTLLFFVAVFIGLTSLPSYSGDIISCDSFENCPDGSVPLTNALLALEARMDALEVENAELKALLTGVSRAVDPNTNQDTLTFGNSISSEALIVPELPATESKGDLPVCFDQNGTLLPCTADFKIPPGDSLIGSWTGMKLTDPNYSGADICYDDEVSLDITPYVSSGPQLRSITTRRIGDGIQVAQFTNIQIVGGFVTSLYSAFGADITFTLRFDTYGNSNGDWFETNGDCYGTWSFTKD
jgi:hypothetical protein